VWPELVHISAIVREVFWLATEKGFCSKPTDVNGTVHEHGHEYMQVNVCLLSIVFEFIG